MDIFRQGQSFSIIFLKQTYTYIQGEVLKQNQLDKKQQKKIL
jgi:hypothetical protein